MVRTAPLALAAAVALAALAGLIGCEQRQPPVFPHNAHVATQQCGEAGQPDCPTCLSCHDGIRRSEDQAIAPVQSCTRCHSPSTPEVDEVSRRVAHWSGGQRGIEFVHADHLELPEIAGQCVRCHEGVIEDGARGNVIPTMAQCLTCHGDEFAQGVCTPCHEARQMRKLVPTTFLRHDLNFLRDHGSEATHQAKVCNQCHNQQECLACHDQGQTITAQQRYPDAIDREFTHRGEFMTGHAIEARASSATCMRCHTISSCDACHVERGVSAARVGSVNPHPRGWIGPDVSSATFHGVSARRDIVSCAVCHDHGPATNCIRCHRPGAFGGSPHPSGWRSSRSQQSEMCRYCHGS